MFSGGKIAVSGCPIVRKTVARIDLNRDGRLDRIGESYCKGEKDPNSITWVELQNENGEYQALTHFVSENPSDDVFRFGFDTGSYNVEPDDFYVMAEDRLDCGGESPRLDKLPIGSIPCSEVTYKIGMKVKLPEYLGGEAVSLSRIAFDIAADGTHIASWAYYMSTENGENSPPIELANLRPVDGGIDWERLAEEVHEEYREKFSSEIAEVERILAGNTCLKHLHLSDTSMRRFSEIDEILDNGLQEIINSKIEYPDFRAFLLKMVLRRM